MSLSLIEDYSSEEDGATPIDGSEDENEVERESSPSNTQSRRIYSPVSKNSKASLLPTPEYLFLEVSGPPEFLKSSATEPIYSRPHDTWRPSPGTLFTSVYKSHPLTDLRKMPQLGVVPEMKTKSFNVHKQVEGDPGNGIHDSKEVAHPVASAGALSNDVSSAVSRQVASKESNSTTEEEKRSRSKIKDKERNKRMKGQSSHATWKSETEMHLRQQFD